jgi:hypothetical protein
MRDSATALDGEVPKIDKPQFGRELFARRLHTTPTTEMAIQKKVRTKARTLYMF